MYVYLTLEDARGSHEKGVMRHAVLGLTGTLLTIIKTKDHRAGKVAAGAVLLSQRERQKSAFDTFSDCFDFCMFSIESETLRIPIIGSQPGRSLPSRSPPQPCAKPCRNRKSITTAQINNLNLPRHHLLRHFNIHSPARLFHSPATAA